MIVKEVEKFVFEYEGKKIHKLVFYSVLKAEGDILIELE
jgi:hypothetical protein